MLESGQLAAAAKTHMASLLLYFARHCQWTDRQAKKVMVLIAEARRAASRVTGEADGGTYIPVTYTKGLPWYEDVSPAAQSERAIKRHCKGRRRTKDRDKEIVALHRQGWTQAKIAAGYGLTQQAVSYIIRRARDGISMARYGRKTIIRTAKMFTNVPSVNRRVRSRRLPVPNPPAADVCWYVATWDASWSYLGLRVCQNLTEHELLEAMRAMNRQHPDARCDREVRGMHRRLQKCRR